MAVSCCVINCSRRFEKGSGITFLRIPDGEPKRSAWINAIRRKNWMPSEHERVCSVHFLSGMFQFCLMLSVEKCHKTNFGFGVLLFYYFGGILYFLLHFRACITFVKPLSSRTNRRSEWPKLCFERSHGLHGGRLLWTLPEEKGKTPVLS